MSPSPVEFVHVLTEASPVEGGVILAAGMVALVFGVAMWWMLRRLFDPIDRR